MSEQQSVGEQLDQKFDGLTTEVDELRNALRTEKARSDLLWELARRRGFVSDEDYVLAGTADVLPT